MLLILNYIRHPVRTRSRPFRTRSSPVRLQITTITFPTIIWTVECMYSRLSWWVFACPYIVEMVVIVICNLAQRPFGLRKPPLSMVFEIVKGVFCSILYLPTWHLCLCVVTSACAYGLSILWSLRPMCLLFVDWLLIVCLLVTVCRFMLVTVCRFIHRFYVFNRGILMYPFISCI